jgi:hypothetical protein
MCWLIDAPNSLATCTRFFSIAGGAVIVSIIKGLKMKKQLTLPGMMEGVWNYF